MATAHGQHDRTRWLYVDDIKKSTEYRKRNGPAPIQAKTWATMPSFRRHNINRMRCVKFCQAETKKGTPTIRQDRRNVVAGMNDWCCKVCGNIAGPQTENKENQRQEEDAESKTSGSRRTGNQDITSTLLIVLFSDLLHFARLKRWFYCSLHVKIFGFTAVSLCSEQLFLSIMEQPFRVSFATVRQL